MHGTWVFFFPPSYPAPPLHFIFSAIPGPTIVCLARTPRLARMSPSHQKGLGHRGLWRVFLQIIKLSSWISAIHPPGLSQTPAEAKNHVTAIATRMEKTCLPNMQPNASCHATRKTVSLNFLKDIGKRLTKAEFIEATNVSTLVESQHVSPSGVTKTHSLTAQLSFTQLSPTIIL